MAAAAAADDDDRTHFAGEMLKYAGSAKVLSVLFLNKNFVFDFRE